MGLHKHDTIPDKAAYQKVVEAFKEKRSGATIADIVSRTALPLSQVRELISRVADEYAARLRVTRSGEICYSFPRGFQSRYRGFGAQARRLGEKLMQGIKIVAATLFKVWIMVMLVGYFVLFMLIALAALLISLSASASRQNSGERDEGHRGMFFTAGIFDLIIRVWFYCELTKTLDPARRGTRRPPAEEKPRRPLYKGIFSFVFGDKDPDGDWPAREKQAVIAYLQSRNGVISLPELMILTGRTAREAEDLAVSYCAQFGGLPEATSDGTVVYRFDQILMQAERQREPRAAPLKRPVAFSVNPLKMNVWFGILNGANLAFGSYFLYSARSADPSFLYLVADALASLAVSDTRVLLAAGLGAVPLVFSLLFWLIPAVRYGILKKRNAAVALENARKRGYARIWESPLAVLPEDLEIIEAGKPAPPVGERLIKEMGSYAMPEVTVDTRGKTVYVFKELAREKEAVRVYRLGINPRDSELGETVFETD